MQHGEKHSNFCGTNIIRLMKLVILGTAVVWYKARPWRARTSGILNSAGGPKKPLEYMLVNRKFSVKRLISHTSEMKGTNFEYLAGLDFHGSGVWRRYCGRQSRKGMDPRQKLVAKKIMEK